MIQQRVERGTSIEMTAAAFSIIRRKQNLRRIKPFFV